MQKTNVMRLLDQAKIEYTPHLYDNSITDGVTIASVLIEDPARVFKTLVTVSDKKVPFVFVIPVAKSLDLKKAAAAVSVKSLSMLRQKDLLPLTGYVHGGCSPIGMKKKFKTVFDDSAADGEIIFFIFFRIGAQVELSTQEAVKYVGATLANITVS